MQLQNPLRAICPALEAEILIALADGRLSTPGALLRERGVHASISGVRRCLERLKENGVVDARHVGNRVEYSLNGEHMLAGLVVEASTATERFTRFLADQIFQWSERPLQATLFGSAARGEMRNDSDIDLLFVVPDGASDQLYEAIGDLAVDAYRFTGNDVRPMVYEVSEVRRAPVFDSIDRDGVHIFGDSYWLSRRLHTLAIA
ncbi:nucleotidyltransferase domain-containing protein [Paenarthrobacter sp. Z7-10]|uniref:nucleotidyltransferase domain-containing protein n=1 Tax=Paenarthrobacter sp. Z7-10 TaxID=2787635 RepID=UPI0022A8D875|nr:nucleotidyltransferase domain-containing protein [Paenarthrobacter sp. Z7-10]MCZ2405044.1 nucleotidyltransferase domain-containing protein [Paenarthrobacter sp. Z7-10]